MFLKDIFKLTFASLILLVSCVNPSYSGSTTNPVYSGSGGSVGPSGALMETQDEGNVQVGNTATMNFTGLGVTATGAGSVVTVAIPGGGTGSGATTETSGIVHPTPVVPGAFVEDLAIGGTNNTANDPNQATFFMDTSTGDLFLNAAGAGVVTIPSVASGEVLSLSEKSSAAGGNTWTIGLGATDLTNDVVCTILQDGSFSAGCPLFNNGMSVSNNPNALVLTFPHGYNDAAPTSGATGNFQYLPPVVLAPEPNGLLTTAALAPGACIGGGSGPTWPCAAAVTVAATGAGDYRLQVYMRKNSMLHHGILPGDPALDHLCDHTLPFTSGTGPCSPSPFTGTSYNFCAMDIWLNNAAKLPELGGFGFGLGNTGGQAVNGPWTHDTLSLSEASYSYDINLQANDTLAFQIGSGAADDRGCSWGSPNWYPTPADGGIIYMSIEKI